jgi:hypothetical protein
MLVQHRFDLGRIDVEARADDQLLGAADDVKNVVVEAREIASVEPALRVDHGRSSFGGPVIAAHDIGTADGGAHGFHRSGPPHRYAVQPSHPPV